MLHEYIRPGTESCRHRGLVEARIPGKRPHDAAGWLPEALLHPRHQYPRCAVPQFRHPQVLGGTDRGRLDLPAQQLHRQCHFAPVEPAVLLRREDRSPDRGRQPRPARRKTCWRNSSSSGAANYRIISSTRTKSSSRPTGRKKPSAIRRWTCASPTTRCARRW